MRTRKTKIICTIGPAVSEPQMLRRLADAGMDMARLNFSHGNHAEFEKTISVLREIEEEKGRPIGIMADIQGPKIRVGKLPKGQISIETGGKIRIVSAEKTSKEDEIPTTYKELVNDVGPGKRILLDDGLMELRTISREGDSLICEVVNGGQLKDGKGINVPDVTFSVHPITEKDYSDVLFCLSQDVDFIAMSFVRTAQEVRHLKEFIRSREKKTLVIAKIEMKDAIRNLDSIIRDSDGILVARGDLAVEVGNEHVPVLQKRIVRESNLQGKPVIIATQMLMSMVENPRPSRAEATDVANAIVEGTDAVMLSNETAVGRFPAEAVLMMSRIVEEMEYAQREAPQSVLYDEWNLAERDTMAMALLQSAVRLSSIVRARSCVVGTSSGFSAQLISKCRPKCPVYAVTGSKATYRQLSLFWGVEGLLMQDVGELISQTTVFEAIGQRLLALNLVSSGDKIVVTAGLPRLVQGSTNTIKVHEI